jgi:histidyl-tRNA synthetase
MPKTPKPQKKKKIIKKEKIKDKKALLQSVKGMHDILPTDQPWWEKVKKATREVADFYNFSRIDTPVLEAAEIFERGVGDATDIVEKQMYVLKTRGGDRLALRPEATAGIVRSYFQHGLSRIGQPVKLYYFGPMFRHEQPQAGRYRQFYQVGFEILGGEDDPVYDAQAILITYRLAEELKIKNLNVQINSIGCKNCRTAHRKKLTDYYKKNVNKICKDCKRRLPVNPLRLLDCKNEKCQEIKTKAPTTIDFLCQPCRSHFRGVLEYLDEVEIPYAINTYLVRGLDYYNRTVFELVAEGLNASLGGGGRYDYLGEMLGARKNSLPAVGSGLGVERLIETIKLQGLSAPAKPKVKVFLIQIGKPAKKKALSLIENFYKGGVRVIESLGKESLKSQLKLADKEGVDIALILGQREVFEESIIIRDMKSGAQETTPLSKVVETVKKKLKV